MNRMSFFSVALGLAIAVPAAGMMTAGVAHAQALPPAVGKPLQAAVAAAKGRNAALANAKLGEAERAATEGAQKRKVAETAAFVYTQLGQWGQAAAKLQQIGARPDQIAPLYYRAGQYQQAIAAAKQAGNSTSMQTIVAQSYLQLNKPAEAAKVYKALINSGKPIDKGWLVNLSGIQYKMGDKAGYLETVQRLLKLDPSTANWQRLLLELKNEQLPPGPQLALYMLMNQTGTLRPEDYQDFAKLSIVGGQPGLAATTLTAAQAAGKLPSDDMTKALVDAATKRAQTAKADAAKLAASVKPDDQLKAGKLLLGVPDYPAAIASLTKASAAGDPEALTQLGVAQVRSGNKTGAVGTFKKAAAANSPYSGIATLWALYCQVARG